MKWLVILLSIFDTIIGGTMMKCVFLSSLILISGLSINGQATQSLTLEVCFTLAKQHYPLTKQRGLLGKSREYTVANVSKGYFPQVNLGGQATFQSDVTEIPIKLPNVDIEAPSKDQYKVYGEISQPLTDLVIIGQQKELYNANFDAEDQKLEIELYKLKDRINQLFFGALLIEEQIKLTRLFISDVKAATNKIMAAFTNGVATKSQVDLMNAELLKAGQRLTELNAAKTGYFLMLGAFVNQQLDDNTTLVIPSLVEVSDDIKRPEVTLFELQKRGLDIQRKLIIAKNLPRASIFLQSGYGKPGLNMLENKFDFYYIGGVRFVWPLSGFYTMKKEKLLIEINRGVLDVQKETFLFNTQLQLKQHNTEIIKLQELIRTDKEIIDLRTSVKKAANAQLENGTITASDYMREVNGEDQAKQNLALHEIQLLMTQYSFQIASGN